LANYRYWFIDCKECGRRITLEIHNHNHAELIQGRSAEKLRCPTCLKECTYSGADFKTGELAP
jgi:hypothetical protein